MPINKNALIRYRTIDKCLSNRQRKWTLVDIIEACTKELYKYEGTKSISRRTIQMDIQNMRSGKLGYEAPIIVTDKKYYSYEDPDFSITNIPISKGELERLNEVVEMLKQFAGFSHFEEIDGMVKKLEDKIEVARSQRKPVIHLEQNLQLKGLDFLDPLYQHILNKEVLAITYQGFQRLNSTKMLIHPYFLKEYKNRWYLIGFNEIKRKIFTLALDRMYDIEIDTNTPFFENNFFNPDVHFKEVIGMTVDLKSKPREILIYVNGKMAPYVLTKPLHPSQKLVWEDQRNIVIAITVKINHELKEMIQSFGQNMMVLKPRRLSNWFEEDTKARQQLYQNKEIRAGIWKKLKRK